MAVSLLKNDARGVIDFKATCAAFEGATLESITAAVDGGADVNEKASDGNTPLLFAAFKANDVRILALLLDRGATITATNYDGADAAEIAKHNQGPNRTEIAELLAARMPKLEQLTYQEAVSRNIPKAQAIKLGLCSGVSAGYTCKEMATIDHWNCCTGCREHDL